MSDAAWISFALSGSSGCFVVTTAGSRVCMHTSSGGFPRKGILRRCCASPLKRSVRYRCWLPTLWVGPVWVHRGKGPNLEREDVVSSDQPIRLPGVPFELGWRLPPERWDLAGEALTIRAGALTDLFVDPAG